MRYTDLKIKKIFMTHTLVLCTSVIVIFVRESFFFIKTRDFLHLYQYLPFQNTPFHNNFRLSLL